MWWFLLPVCAALPHSALLLSLVLVGSCCCLNLLGSCCCKQAFKEQKYPEAVKFYTEALARGPPKVNPDAHKLHSNRAACYTKLGAWDAGLKDADECIKLKPDFTKGYVRKVLSYACC